MPEHHKERNAELKHAEFHPTDLRIVRYRRPDTADEQVTKTAVEDQLWRHTESIQPMMPANGCCPSHAHPTFATQVRIIVFRVNEAGVAFLQFQQGLIWRQSGKSRSCPYWVMSAWMRRGWCARMMGVGETAQAG